MTCYYGCKTNHAWRCKTCGEVYCYDLHSHTTSKGDCVECVACESIRKEKKRRKG